MVFDKNFFEVYMESVANLIYHVEVYQLFWLVKRIKFCVIMTLLLT